TRHAVVLGHPEAPIAELIGGARESQGVGERFGVGGAVSDGREVENGERNSHPWAEPGEPPVHSLGAPPVVEELAQRASRNHSHDPDDPPRWLRSSRSERLETTPVGSPTSGFETAPAAPPQPPEEVSSPHPRGVAPPTRFSVAASLSCPGCTCSSALTG